MHNSFTKKHRWKKNQENLLNYSKIEMNIRELKAWFKIENVNTLD